METREAWLERAVEVIRPWLLFADTPRVSVGFPRGGRGKGNTAIGQCWATAAAADGRTQIFISPVLETAEEVLAVLLHELIHHKVGVAAGHKAPFKREMKHVGLEGKATATVPGAQCSAVLARFAADLGPFPHAPLSPNDGRKKQTTRLLKAGCDGCGCVIRVTRQWAGAAGELLPFCGFCGIEGNADTMERMKLLGAEGDEGEA